MALWAIGYDLAVSNMKTDGFSKSQVTQFYNSIRKCLLDNNFEKQKQWSIYTSSKENSVTDAFQVCMAMKAVPDADKYVKRLHLFRVEDFNDLLPLVADKSSAEKDEIEEEIEEIFGKEVAAMIRN